jgi:hypothetical protein
VSVSGQYKKTFREATHCCFNGNLDDPFFRRVAIQKITAIAEHSVTVEESGQLDVCVRNGAEFVALTYKGIFGNQKTTGHPFKDASTELPNKAMGEYWCRCQKCSASTRAESTEHEAVKAWNRRAQSPAVRELVEAAKHVSSPPSETTPTMRICRRPSPPSIGKERQHDLRQPQLPAPGRPRHAVNPALPRPLERGAGRGGG